MAYSTTLQELMAVTFMLLLSFDGDNMLHLKFFNHSGSLDSSEGNNIRNYKKSHSSFLINGLVHGIPSFDIQSNRIIHNNFKIDHIKYKFIDREDSKYNYKNGEDEETADDNEEDEQEDDDELNHQQKISRTVDPTIVNRLESKFLKLFGMKEKPKNTHNKKKNIPTFLLHLYDRQKEQTMPTFHLPLPGSKTRTANTVRSFHDDHHTFRQSKWEEFSKDGSKHYLKFDLKMLPSHEIVTGANLRVPFALTKKADGEVWTKDDENLSRVNVKKVRVLLHDVMRKGWRKNSTETPKYEPISYPIDSKVIDLSKRRNGTSVFWLTFDVYPAVKRWKKKSSWNHGLILQIIGFDDQGIQVPHQFIAHSHKLRVKRDLVESSSSIKTKSSQETSQKLSSGESKIPLSHRQGAEMGAASRMQNEVELSSQRNPILFTYSDDGMHKKNRRDGKSLTRQYRQAVRRNRKRRKKHRNKHHRRPLCSRHAMFVDFDDVGWNDWIVAPPGYHAFYCSGHCPFPMSDHLNATNHAVIQALVHSMRPGSVPPPCCVPKQYSPVSLLYKESSGNYVLKNYNEMVVDSCGCS